MTSMPAQKLGLRDRGLVREGMWADLVLFNPDTIIDRATYDNPCQRPEGIEYVLINGVVTVEEGTYTEALPGVALLNYPP